MKLSVIVIVLALFMFAGAGFASAEERSVPFITSLSSTTVRGYISTGTHWQEHVCRPVQPVRVDRVLEASTSGQPREVGRAVRCRHAVVFVPNAAGGGAYPTPNRSSGFAPGRRPWWINPQVVSVRVPPRRVRRPLPPPPVPPYQGTNQPPRPPVVVMPPRSNDVTIIRPPVIFTNLPPGGILITSLPPRFRPVTNGPALPPPRVIPGTPESVLLLVRPLDWTNIFSAVVPGSQLPQIIIRSSGTSPAP
jgi:hypothetical protein